MTIRSLDIRKARLLLVSLAFLVLALGTQKANGIGNGDFSAQTGPIPTNTQRPTETDTPGPYPTNTPHPTETDTLAPTDTASPTDTPIPTDTPTFTATPIPLGPMVYPDNINSLTGLPYPDDASRNRRNLIVKVSNYTPVVRPQSGLSDADIVYEYEVEGGVTRFAAIFRGKGTDHVGSIRSGRLLDFELVVAYDGILAYSGSNAPIAKMIQEGSCIDPKSGSRVICTTDPKLIHAQTWKYRALTPQFGANCPPFCRFPTPGLAFEHTLFGNTYQMWDLATKYQQNTPHKVQGLAFADQPDPNGATASDIALKWYQDQDARWQYNANDGLYYRWNTGLPHLDANTGKQLTADNVIILQATHLNRPDIYESEAGSPAVEIQLWDQGPAWVFRDGQWYKGIWKRDHDKGGLFLYQTDGKTPIHLKPGNSWFEVVRPNMYGVKVSDQITDMQPTETAAAMTMTARFPALPDANLTQTQAVATGTWSASAATNAYTPGTPADTATDISPSETATP